MNINKKANISCSLDNCGFTLVEMVLVIVVLGILSAFAAPRMLNLSNNATLTNVQSQASALISNNVNNEISCRLGMEDCIDISQTGTEACIEAITQFLPDLDLTLYNVENISSTVPESEWAELTGDHQALFWITRFLGPSEPTQWVLDNGNVKQPCLLSAR